MTTRIVSFQNEPLIYFQVEATGVTDLQYNLTCNVSNLVSNTVETVDFQTE